MKSYFRNTILSVKIMFPIQPPSPTPLFFSPLSFLSFVIILMGGGVLCLLKNPRFRENQSTKIYFASWNVSVMHQHHPIIFSYIDVGHCLKFWYRIFISHVFKPWETSTVLLLPRPLKTLKFLSNRCMTYYDQNQDCHSFFFFLRKKIVIAGATYTVKRNAIIYSLKVHECLVKLLWLNLLYQIMILNLIRQVTWDKISEIRIW